MDRYDNNPAAMLEKCIIMYIVIYIIPNLKGQAHSWPSCSVVGKQTAPVTWFLR